MMLGVLDIDIYGPSHMSLAVAIQRFGRVLSHGSFVVPVGS